MVRFPGGAAHDVRFFRGHCCHFVIRWSIWRQPICLACIRALLGHPDLESRETLAVLGIVEARQAWRISAAKFMNVTRAVPEAPP